MRICCSDLLPTTPVQPNKTLTSTHPPASKALDQMATCVNDHPGKGEPFKDKRISLFAGASKLSQKISAGNRREGRVAQQPSQKPTPGRRIQTFTLANRRASGLPKGMPPSLSHACTQPGAVPPHRLPAPAFPYPPCSLCLARARRGAFPTWWAKKKSGAPRRSDHPVAHTHAAAAEGRGLAKGGEMEAALTAARVLLLLLLLPLPLLPRRSPPLA